jgi:methionyl-tRNA formyltransferase
MTILFLAKQKPFAKEASELIRLHFNKSEIVFGQIDNPFPDHLYGIKFDYVISYISPWIVPKHILDNTKIAAINLHPGPPQYPGIGCTNFALYNSEKTFGITVHHMKEKVDTGGIIHVERFPIFENDTVYSLTQRCYAHIYIAFIKMFSLILSNKPLPLSQEKWKRKPYTKKELNDLCIITKDMSDNEIKRRVKATAYPNMPGAFIELAGIKFSIGESIDAENYIDRRGGARKSPDRFNEKLWPIRNCRYFGLAA